MNKSRLILSSTALVSIVLLTVTLVLLAGSTPADSDILPTLAQLPTAAVADAAAAPVQIAQQPADSVQPVAQPPVAAPATDTPTSPTATQASQTEPVTIQIEDDAVPGQVIIEFAADASPEEREAFVASLDGATVSQAITENAVVLRVPDETTLDQIPASPVVAASEPDYFVSALIDVPTSDPYYPQQWALPVIGAPDAWLELPADAPQVTVAVIDSGICADHPDLAGRVLAGWDFVENDNTPQDDFGHGCGVSGVIAANTDDGIGMAGIAPNAMILPLRVLDANGLGTYSNVAAAIVRAADSGAQIINLSLGGPNPSTVLNNAIDYAIGKGAMVIAAAGNTGGAVLYPAAYAPVIAVGSVDASLERSSFSSYGPEIDLWAPGRDILVTGPDGNHRTVSGTSFAAPHVAGVAVVEVGQGRSLTTSNRSIANIGGQNIIIVDPTIAAPEVTNTPASDSLIIEYDTIVELPQYLRDSVAQTLAMNPSAMSRSNHLVVSSYRLDDSGDWASVILVPSG